MPDLGIRPLSLWEKYLLKPFESKIKEIEIIITKVTGVSPKITENISNVAQMAVGVYNEIESFFSKIKFILPAGLTQAPSPEIEYSSRETAKQKALKEAEIEPIEPKEVKSETKEKLNLTDIQEMLDDIAEQIDILNQEVAGKVEAAKKKEFQPKKMVKGAQTEREEEKVTEDELEEKIEEKEKEVLPETPQLCQKIAGSYPLRNKVIINEVAWMGTTNSANDEWIELKNISGQELDLSGWQLLDKDNQIKIIFVNRELVSVNELWLLERTNDESAPGVTADFIYSGALSNKNEALYLFNENCQLQDEVLANPDWPAGINSSKRTMERRSNLEWQAGSNINGTPKRENSSGYYSGGGTGGGTATFSEETPQFFPVIINEIMYNPAGADNYREWIEVFNNGESSVDLSQWKFFENEVNHKLTLIQGSNILSSRAYAVITNNEELSDYPTYSGILFKSSFSLKNSGEEITLKNGDLIIDKVNYNSFWGAYEDGKSLQRIDPDESSNNSQNWQAASPTPGAENQFPSPQPAVLEVSPQKLEFRLISSAKSISISNIGGSILNWQSSIEYVTPQIDGWLSLSPQSGEISAGLTSEVSISPIETVSGLVDGVYSAKININAGEIEGSPAQIDVSWDNQQLTDETLPTVEFNILPSVLSSISFALSWLGEDPIGVVSPSGIDGFLLSYDVSPSEDGAALLYFKDDWQDWPKNETIKINENQINLLGKDGYSYFFEIKTLDKAGNLSPESTTSTKIEIPKDTTPPELDFDAIVSPQTVSFFTVSWSGEDPTDTVSPSGLDGFLLRYSEDEENWTYWPLENEYTQETQYDFTGEDEQTYYFQIKAKDKAGNESEWKETSVKISFPKTLIISEVQIADKEFVELYNFGDRELDLSNCYFSYFSPGRDWNDPWRNKKFPEETTILAKSYYLIGLEGYPDSDWPVYDSAQFNNEAGGIVIFSSNPKNTDDNPKTVEQAENCKIDALGWGETTVKEGASAAPPLAGQSLGRRWNEEEQEYQDSNNNENDFEVQELSPGEKNKNRDKTSPFVTFNSLTSPQTSLSFTLSWSGEDPMGEVNPSGLDGFYLQYSVVPNPDEVVLQYQDGEQWQNWSEGETGEIKTELSSLNLLGEDGYTYTFQIKAEDKAGNQSETDSISIEIEIELLSAGGILPITYQTSSYREGDDGYYKIGCNKGYTDNEDGTITDNCTGLIWVKDGTGAGCNNGGKLTVMNAVSFAADLTFAGYSDWRLPNLKELQSIVNYSKDAPTIDEKFTNTFSDKYWSSSFFADGSWYWRAHFVDFSDGSLSYELTKAGSTVPQDSTPQYIRPVRGPEVADTLPITGLEIVDINPPYHNWAENTDSHLQKGCKKGFRDNGDGTITDLCTNLMWAKDKNGAGCDSGNDTANWVYAIDFAEDLDFVGYQDWRIPNVRELLSITDPQSPFYYAPPSYYAPMTSNSFYYVSSTTVASDTDKYWAVMFKGGYVEIAKLNKAPGSAQRYLRAVRTAE